jgi:2-dehydro-3-deoxy-D-pentonate aldolase
MANDIIAKPIRGVVPPMVTPLATDEELDQRGLNQLVEHLIQGGVHGIFILGTTGEGLSLSHSTRRALIQRVNELVEGRVPVLVGVTDTSLLESIALAEFAGQAGASAVVLAPPVYFPHEQAELVRCATLVAERSPLPVMLYNIPALTKIAFEPDTVAQLCEVPNIIGIKDSSGDLDYFQAIRNRTIGRGDWSLFTGHDLLLGQAVASGAHGGVCGGANVFPRLFVDLYEAAVTSNHARVADLQKSILKLTELYQLRGNSTLSVIRGIKSALVELGVCSGRMAAPASELPEVCRHQVRDILSSVYEEFPSITL